MRFVNQIIGDELEAIDTEIILFKQEVRMNTNWDTGYDMREYMDKEQCIEYGRLLGKRDALDNLVDEMKKGSGAAE